MAGLNIDYLVTPSLQEIYVNPSTGLPLANGKLKFFKDNARSIPKNVYKLSGSPLGYTYTDLGSEVDLSIAGTPIDEDGNDIKIYYYPYDSSDSLELYYVKILDSFGTEIFDRQGWPNLGITTSTSDNVTNYFKNGQFLAFNTNVFPDYVIDISTPNNFIFSGDRALRNNKWVFDKNNTTAKDTLELVHFPQNVTIEGSPRYYIDINCTQAGSGETYKRFYYMEQNCRQFENQEITVSFQFKSTTSSTVEIYFERNYGSGGSATDVFKMGTFVLDSNFDKYSLNYTIPTTDGKLIGANDDFWLIYISFPINHTFNVGFTNAQLNLGNKILQFLPEIMSDSTNKQKVDIIQSPQPYNYQNPFDYRNNVLSFQYDPSSGISGYSNFDSTPIGSLIQSAANWHSPSVSLYYYNLGYLLCDGTVLVKAYHRKYFDIVGQSYGATGDTRAVAIGDTVTITNVQVGSTNNAIDINTGFTITTTQSGTPSLPQITQVVCKQSSDFENCSMFRFRPANYSADFIVIFVKNYQMRLPAIPSGGSQWVPVFITQNGSSSDTATALAEVFNYLTCNLPDPRGYFFRSVDMGAGRDPDRASRQGRPDGVIGDNVGTTQVDVYGSHMHTNTVTYTNDTACHRVAPGTGDVDFVAGSKIVDVPVASLLNLGITINANGGGETRPKNFNVFTYIKVI